LSVGDWGLGIGDWGLGPIPNPHYNQQKNKNNSFNWYLIRTLLILKYFKLFVYLI